MGRAISGQVRNQLRYFDMYPVHICTVRLIAVEFLHGNVTQLLKLLHHYLMLEWLH